jgi:hypothetical protein
MAHAPAFQARRARRIAVHAATVRCAHTPVHICAHDDGHGGSGSDGDGGGGNGTSMSSAAAAAAAGWPARAPGDATATLHRHGFAGFQELARVPAFPCHGFAFPV